MSDTGLTITVKGMADARKQMERIERGLKAMKGFVGIVKSGLPYAYGIHEGRHRKGGVARKAGGSFYIRRAIDTVLSGADRDLSEGLDKVTAPGRWVIKRLALWARRLARRNAPRGPSKKSHSYRLRRSIKYEVRKR